MRLLSQHAANLWTILKIHIVVLFMQTDGILLTSQLLVLSNKLWPIYNALLSSQRLLPETAAHFQKPEVGEL